jgi:hypothetical protein
MDAAIGRANTPDVLCGDLVSHVAPQRDTVPCDEGELQERRRRPGEIPVEYPGDLIAVKADVVRGDVVVADERGPRCLRVPPRARVTEPGNRLVEAACPRGERVDLAWRQQLGVNIDDPPGQESEHLTALLIEPQHPRNVLGTRGEEIEKGMNRWRPWTRCPVHRATDPPRATHIASQPYRLPRLAPVGITHASSIGLAFPELAGTPPKSAIAGNGSGHRIALQPPRPAVIRSCRM